MQMSVCEAGQSNLAGQSAHFLEGKWEREQCKLFEARSSDLCIPRGLYNSWSKHFFAECGKVVMCNHKTHKLAI